MSKLDFFLSKLSLGQDILTPEFCFIKSAFLLIMRSFSVAHHCAAPGSLVIKVKISENY